MLLVAREQEVRDHPCDSCVAADLAENDVERAHRPLACEQILALMERHIELVYHLIIMERRDCRVDACGLVGEEVVGQVFEFDRVQVDPLVVVNLNRLLHQVIERVQRFAIVVEEVGNELLASVLDFATGLLVCRWEEERVHLLDLDDCAALDVSWVAICAHVLNSDREEVVGAFEGQTLVVPAALEDLVAWQVRAEELRGPVDELIVNLLQRVLVRDVLRENHVAWQSIDSRDSICTGLQLVVEIEVVLVVKRTRNVRLSVRVDVERREALR